MSKAWQVHINSSENIGKYHPHQAPTDGVGDLVCHLIPKSGDFMSE